MAQKNPEVQDPKAADLYREAVLARIVQITRLPNGTTKVLFEGQSRVYGDSDTSHEEGGRQRSAVRTYHTHPLQPRRIAIHSSSGPVASGRWRCSRSMSALQRRVPQEVVAMVQAAETLDRQVYGIAAHLATKLEVRQRCWKRTSLEEAFARLIDLLASETEVLQLERKIDDETRGAMFQNQREFYLQEQLKAIHRELGQEDGDDVTELDAQMRRRCSRSRSATRANRELRKLRRMSPMSPEYTVTRNFVDWITSLPWDERTDETLDLAHARRVLDADHYGLEDVKDRILDFIAVLSLVGRVEGPILCLVGPPGVGKTSLGTLHCSRAGPQVRAHVAGRRS